MKTPTAQDTEITALLLAWRGGNEQALAILMPRVYGQLKEIAQRLLRGHQGYDTLQSTALVHEAYLRLEGLEDLELASPCRETLIARDLWPLKDEPHPSVGQIDPGGLFGVALIGSIAETNESAQSAFGIVEVEIHRLVEVRGPQRIVHIFVFWKLWQ